MRDFHKLSEDYERIEKAIQFIENNFLRKPSLSEIAAAIGLSEFHFQRLFTRWSGISPKRFLQYLTKEYAKKQLEQSQNLLDVADVAGLSGSGRLHDLFVSCEAVTPGEYRSRGEGLTIHFGFHATPFGECLLALTPRGICALSFSNRDGRKSPLHDLKKRWEGAALREDSKTTGEFVRTIFAPMKGGKQLRLHLKGTNFQIKVWEALLGIPEGAVATYSDVARRIGMPGAARAVGSAIGENPVAYLIPCHRVIRKVGDFGGYRWGSPRKKVILGWEMKNKGTQVESGEMSCGFSR